MAIGADLCHDLVAAGFGRAAGHGREAGEWQRRRRVVVHNDVGELGDRAQARAEAALVIVSEVVKVFEATRKSVRSASR